MAILPGSRIRKNGAFGTITDNPLTAGAVTFNSAALTTLPVVTGNHAIITLDPLKQFGNPEIVMVTAHTAAATVATITRGMFGTVARSHPQGTLWVHAATQDDYIEVLTSSTRPADQYEGQTIYETDTNRYAGFDGIAWWPGGFISIATSASRPSLPFKGQHIFETDTNKLVGFGGVDWAPRDAGGQIGYAQAVVSQGPFSALTDLTSLTVPVTVGTGRRIRITGQTYPSTSDNASRVTLSINEGVTQFQEASIVPNSSAISLGLQIVFTPTVGSHTYKLSMARTVGAGTITNNANPTFPSFILVEDIGAA